MKSTSTCHNLTTKKTKTCTNLFTLFDLLMYNCHSLILQQLTVTTTVTPEVYLCSALKRFFFIKAKPKAAYKHRISEYLTVKCAKRKQSEGNLSIFFSF